MKRIGIYLLIMISGLTSCGDLDINPNDRPSSETFWKTSEDINLALTACYGAMHRDLFSFSTPCWDNLTDNGYGQHAERQYGMTTNMVMGNIEPSSDGFISAVYTDAFADIATVNIFLDKLKKIDKLNDIIKKQYEAEARMLRAYFYSYLYRGYGEVPIISEPLNLETQYQEKKPMSDVYKFIMDDISFAIDNLPDQTYSESKGRWTKNAAKAYKARMILFTAYDEEGNMITNKMTEAKTLLGEIKGYALANDFSDNFNDLKQESSPEIMMSIKFLAPGQPIPKKAGSKFLIDLEAFSNTSLADRDPRLAKTVFIEKYIINGSEYTGGNAKPTGAGLYKFLSPNLPPPFSYNTKSQQDWVIMRYADVLLMLAEAENELNGPTELVYKSINAIRKRALMPELPPKLSKEQMRNKIRNERRIELAFEGHRYFDLKRWRTAISVLNAVADAPVTYKFEKKHYLWPIPQSEIDKNKGKLVQNPDW